MILNIFLLILGFVLLIKGSDIFVDGSSSIASHFKISKMVIGLTIVAFGTSSPELAISIKSLLSNSSDIILGNVIGSNIMNVLLILGISALVHNLSVKNATVKKELPTFILLSCLFSVLLCDNLFDSLSPRFTRSDGIVVLLFFSIFIYYLISRIRNKTVEDETNDENTMPLLKAIIFSILGVICIILGSNFVVDSASFLAKNIGISERMISLTIVAFGTSLPELVTSIVATKKGEYDIAIGNVVGSNIFNIGIVIGLPVALIGGINKVSFNYIDIATLIISSILLLLFAYNDRKISKREGIIFLLIFVVYYSYVIFA